MSADRPPVAASGRMEMWGRFVRAYALDLAVSLAVVLTAARIWSMIFWTTPDTPWILQLQAAITRFTPLGLWGIYSEQLRMAVADTTGNPGSAIAYGMMSCIWLLYDVVYAAARTIGVIWQQTESVGDWATLVGFAGLLTASFIVLTIGGGRFSVGRLLLAVVVGPPATIALFWVAQQTALDALNGFAIYAAVAPWCLLCPVVCTLYWVLFPGAEHSATASCIATIRRPRLMGRGRRGLADGVSTISLTRRR